MTNEEKQLLLIDLCGRLPHGVKILQGEVVIETLQSICKVGDNEFTINPISYDIYNGFSIEEVKPYLRPMSSMTEEEKEEYEMLQVYPGFKTNHTDLTDMYDWLNAHYFDYRGLIPMGLALEAPEGMYKTE